jgi:hypothetical protein
MNIIPFVQLQLCNKKPVANRAMTETDDVVNSEINLAVEIIDGRKCANTKIQCLFPDSGCAIHLSDFLIARSAARKNSAFYRFHCIFGMQWNTIFFGVFGDTKNTLYWSKCRV